jgi:diguanylate cyclase (GGDEF)-like protein
LIEFGGRNESRVDTAPSAPDEFLIVRDVESCRSCWSCVRHCPAQAIRVVHGRPEIVESRCVKCGVCVLECGHEGYVPRDDLERVRSLLAGDRRVVAVLASEYLAALFPMTAAEIEFALEEAGFDSVETTVLGEELVAAAYEQVRAAAPGSIPRLRSTCPVVVSWVERFHPQLTGALVTLVPPYIAQARLVKATSSANTAVVYVSPCWARKDEIFETQLAGAVDAAIGFDELKSLLAEESASRRSPSKDPVVMRRPQAAKELSLTDGFPRRFLVERDMTSPDVVTARGLTEIDRLLTAIERGETAPNVVDLLNCEGCTDGPAVNSELSVFVKRNVIAAENARQPRPAVDSRTLLSALPAIELRRSFSPAPVLSRVPSAEEIDAVLAEGEFYSRAEVLDCGACGHPTCVAHAAAVCLGDSSWDLCFPLQRKLLVRERAEMADRAASDALTGLGNRRAFDERLEEETARAVRYGTELSLAMIDLDDFKEVNDRFGHPFGDQLLIHVGHILTETLRETDIPTRYGGDEFAIILPATSKTEAWVVAEKIRTALGELTLVTEDGRRISASGSIGVAAYGPSAPSAHALLGAADAALYRAKRRGRDRVELAAG